MIKMSIEQNIKIWGEIHDSIQTNDLNQLMTLLSQHPINLNSFSVSTYGDTLLHSAVKSNDVKMMEFILQRLSPSTKRQMLKIRNKQGQPPSYFLRVRRWTPLIHLLFPLKFKRVVKTVLMLGAKRQDGTPYYPQTHFYKLPKDVLYHILQYAAPYNTPQ
jgi:ankyrin repeat protein